MPGKTKRKTCTYMTNLRMSKLLAPCPIMANVITEKELKEQLIVFDRGDNENPEIKRPTNIKHKIWRRIQVSDGKHLHVVKSDDQNKCLIHTALQMVNQTSLYLYHDMKL